MVDRLARRLQDGESYSDAIERLLDSTLDAPELVDRTLRVGRVEHLSAGDAADREGTTLLCASGDGTLAATSLPDDPVERRDLIPTPVLRTG